MRDLLSPGLELDVLDGDAVAGELEVDLTGGLMPRGFARPPTLPP